MRQRLSYSYFILLIAFFIQSDEEDRSGAG
jgi:hypothetical protein